MAVRAAACPDDRTKLPPALPPNSLLKKEKYILEVKEIPVKNKRNMCYKIQEISIKTSLS